SEDDLSPDGFPYFCAREVTVGYVPALALRVSYVGELGWELYAPTEYGLTLWDTLWGAGQDLGAIAAGGGGVGSPALATGGRAWGGRTPTRGPPRRGRGGAPRAAGPGGGLWAGGPCWPAGAE